MALSEPDEMRAAAMQATRARYTKTDYEMVASILKTQHDAAQAMNNTARDAEVIAQMTSDSAHRFAEAFARDCPKFDRVRFFRDCRVQP